jgi:hypothetical protein
MGNCTPKSPTPEPECFCIEPLKNVWYLEGYYTETGEPILPEPLEPEYVPRKPEISVEWVSEPCDFDKPCLSPRFTGKLAPLKLFS